MLPSDLQNLTFGYSFNLNLNNTSFPSQNINLTFGYSFNINLNTCCQNIQSTHV